MILSPGGIDFGGEKVMDGWKGDDWVLIKSFILIYVNNEYDDIIKI